MEINEELHDKKWELFDTMESELYWDEELSEFIWEIFEDMTELSFAEFISELDWKFHSEDYRLWGIVKNYSCVENPITLNEARKYLIEDIQKYFN